MSIAIAQAAIRPLRAIPIAPAGLPRPEAQCAASCTACHVHDLCLPGGLDLIETRRLDSLMFARRRVSAGRTLYRAGDKFAFLYAVRSGTFKSHLTRADAGEQVTGFHIGGELMGLDGVANGLHASTATALEDTEICAIPYARLCELAQGSAGMQQLGTRMMSRELVREQSLMLLLGSMNSEERLAAFLLNLSRRFKARGYSASEFNLRMSRAEIGSYLGLTLETVSRTFSAFQRRRLLEVDKRSVRIVDPAAFAASFEIRLH